MKLNPLYGVYAILAAHLIMMLRTRFTRTDNAWGGMNDMGIMIVGILVIIALLAVFGFSFLNVRGAMIPLTMLISLLLLASILSLLRIVPILDDVQRQRVLPEGIATVIASLYYLIALWLKKS